MHATLIKSVQAYPIGAHGTIVHTFQATRLQPHQAHLLKMDDGEYLTVFPEEIEMHG